MASSTNDKNETEANDEGINFFLEIKNTNTQLMPSRYKDENNLH